MLNGIYTCMFILYIKCQLVKNRLFCEEGVNQTGSDWTAIAVSVTGISLPVEWKERVSRSIVTL